MDSLNYCVDNLGMEVYCWCIMPSHLHLIFSARDNNPQIILGRFKEHTSKAVVKAISENSGGSRREWMLWMFKREAAKQSNVKNYPFWQHDNHPIEVWSPKVIEQKADYLHENPTAAGFVVEPWYWKYSSAIDYYTEGKGLVSISFL